MRVEKVLLEYQPTISEAPVSRHQMYGRATSNDGATVDHWKDTWLEHIAVNKENYGSFHDFSVASEFGKYARGAAIVAGSGPSLKVNSHLLKDRHGIPLVSCLHNFHYFEDLDLAPEYYVSLDAGKDITLEEMSEGGKQSPEWYWERSKDRTLVAYIGTSPKLLEKWQGRILFFNCALPDQGLNDKIQAIENFRIFFSTGGNVLGAGLYLARAILGCFTVVFTGADFSFGYPDFSDDKPVHRFHSWRSKYDKEMGKTLRVTDVFGNKVHTWPSYYNFKSYFDWFGSQIPGCYINATEGGCLGAYDQGNLIHFRYLSLEDALRQLNGFYSLEESMTNREIKSNQVLYQ